jgi:hypothetical protein
MFDQVKNQPKTKCAHCKKIMADTGLCSIWQVKKGKIQIKKSKVCEQCFYTEKEKMILE